MRRYLIALLISAAIIAGFFVLYFVMHWRLQVHMAHGDDIPWWELILMGIAKFWGVFWPIGSLFILTASFGVAHVAHIIQLLQAPQGKSGSS